MVAATHPTVSLWWWFAHGWNINRRTYEPRTREPRDNMFVGGVWWWLWWHIVGLSINKPNTQVIQWCSVRIMLVVGVGCWFFPEHY